MHERRINKRYFLEFGGAMGTYALLLVASIMLGRPMTDGVARMVFLMSPVLGIGLLIWAIARHMRRTDEYIRQSALESIAIAAAVTGGLTFTYGFLENLGYPRLSMFCVWPLMAGVWGMIAIARNWMER